MRILFIVVLSLCALSASAATFTVTSADDAGAGTLRAAVEAANAKPGLDAIDFNLESSARTITLLSPISITSPLVIDGGTQEGYGGTPVVMLASILRRDGLIFDGGSDGSSVFNLLFGKFSTAITILGASHVVVAGNYVGGVDAYISPLSNATGIRVYSARNVIERNVFVNDTHDVMLMPGSTRNTIQENIFGFDPAGLVARFPAAMCVNVEGATENLIARNVMITSGNAIQLVSSATANRIEGNRIGFDANGNATEMYPGTSGIYAGSETVGTIIGGTAAAARNVIGNMDKGISLGARAFVHGNYLGVTPDGRSAAPNAVGVLVFSSGAQEIVIGGRRRGEGNVISGNERYGVYLSARGGVLEGNFIGTAPDGLTALPNGVGVYLQAFGARVGGALPGARNVISGNRGHGIENEFLFNDSSSGTITGNFIGLGADGVTPVPNGGDGIHLAQRHAFTIRANRIDANGGLGIDRVDDKRPRLERAIVGAETIVSGTYQNTPSTVLRIDVYASPSPDASGFGEGREYLGTALTATNAAGRAMFTSSVRAASEGMIITATATGPDGTSEFSNALAAELAGTLQFSATSYEVAEGGTITITVERAGGSAGAASVEYTITGESATAGEDYTPVTGMLTFDEGQTTAAFEIAAIDDGVAEGSESALIVLSNATGNVLIGPPAALLVKD